MEYFDVLAWSLLLITDSRSSLHGAQCTGPPRLTFSETCVAWPWSGSKNQYRGFAPQRQIGIN